MSTSNESGAYSPALADSMPDHSETHVLAAASMPWAFSQCQPLGTSEFCKDAERRGITLDERVLRELWRVGALFPFVEVRNTRSHNPVPPKVAEPPMASTYVREIRLARDTGRLIDPAELGYRPQIRFSLPRPARLTWWNGLLYSRWQLLELHDMKNLLTQGRRTWKKQRLCWRSRDLSELEVGLARDGRRLSTLLVALDPRYHPAIERGWVSPVNATVDEWENFVSSFDPMEVLNSISSDPDELLRAAERLLLGLHRSDPLGREWSELVRRAPRRTWDLLSGDALTAVDRRIAAELLLLCYEDLATRGDAPPLSDRFDLFQAESERISYRGVPLDATLSALGASPHPGVVLVVEGETEEFFVPRVRDHIRIPDQAEVIQSVVLRGVGSDMTKLAAYASAPLIEREQAGDWLLVKPPTRLMVVVDPDKGFGTPKAVEDQKRKIVDEIVAVVRAQGVDPDRAGIESLVDVTTWNESCFEFEHFTDSELADALFSVHHSCGGLTRDHLIKALEQTRGHRQDIKQIWSKWRPKVSKIDLAKALWPTLRLKLDTAASDDTLEPPAIAERLVAAFHSSMGRPDGRFVLRGVAIAR